MPRVPRGYPPLPVERLAEWVAQARALGADLAAVNFDPPREDPEALLDLREALGMMVSRVYEIYFEGERIRNDLHKHHGRLTEPEHWPVRLFYPPESKLDEAAGVEDARAHAALHAREAVERIRPVGPEDEEDGSPSP